MPRWSSVLVGFALLVARDEQGKAAPACTSVQHRAFDFWAGEWEVFAFADPRKLMAHARVQIILEGCVLHEVYEGANGLKGQSFSSYDTSRGAWQQSWFTNRGQVLLLDGGLQGDRMVLTGPQRGARGQPQLIRGEWRLVTDGVREVAQTSDDGGKTWQPLFDLVFRPARGGRR